MATWRQGILLALALLLVSGGSCLQREPGRPIGKAVTTPPSPNLPPKEWQPPTLLRTSSNDLRNIRVAVSNRGDAVVTWIEFPSMEIRANMFTQQGNLRLGPLCCWKDPNQTQHVGDSDTEEASPEVGIDDNGNSLAVWNKKNYIFVNTHRRGASGWGNSRSIRAYTLLLHPMNPPHLAMNRYGNALVAWQEKNFATIQGFNVGAFFINAKTSGYPWDFSSDLIPLISNPGMFSSFYDDTPQVALNQSNTGMVVWYEGSSIHYNYGPVSGGNRPIFNMSAEKPYVALDGMGNGLAVWTSSNRIFAGRFTPASGGQWEGQPTEISAPQTGASDARVALQQSSPDSPGQGVAVWVQGGNIFATRFDPAAGGWEAQPHALSTGGDASEPKIAIDSRGAALAVWIQWVAGEQGVYAAHFTPGQGWGAPVPLKTRSGNASHADLAMAPGGMALVAWSQGQDIYARFYASTLP